MNTKISNNIDGYKQILEIGGHTIDGTVLYDQRYNGEIQVTLLLGIDDSNFYAKAVEFTLENEELTKASRSLLAEELIKTYSMILVPELMELKAETTKKIKKPEIKATMHLRKTGDEIIDAIYAILKKSAPYLKIKQQGGKR